MLPACGAKGGEETSAPETVTTAQKQTVTFNTTQKPAEPEPVSHTYEAKVLSFDDAAITLLCDGEEVTIYKNVGENDLYFNSPRFAMLFSDPLKKGHTLRVTLSPYKTEITQLDFLPVGCKAVDKDFYMTFELVSFGVSSVTGKKDGEEFTARLAPELLRDSYFTDKYINKPYMATGILYPDGDILFVNLCPAQIEIDEEAYDYSTLLYKFGTAKITAVNDDGTLAVTRLRDGKSLDILPLVYGDNKPYKEGELIYYRPLSGKEYDSPDITLEDPCCVLHANDISGDVTLITDSPTLTLQTVVNGMNITVYPDALTDENGKEITLKDTKHLVDLKLTINAENITCAQPDEDDMYCFASSVTVTGTAL